MKSKLKLTDQFLGSLPAELTDGIEEELKDVDEPTLKRIPTSREFTLEEDSERQALNYASTRNLDRDNEIVVPGGVSLTQFRKAPVLLWGHRWSEPPIGSDKRISSDGYGLRALSEFAETEKGEEIWRLIKGKHLRTSSIGFIGLKWIYNSKEGWNDLIDKLVKEWDEFKVDVAEKCYRIATKSLLLEHSIVSVPSNIDALTLAVSEKNIELTAEMLEELGVEVDIETEVEAINKIYDDNETSEEDEGETVVVEEKEVSPSLVVKLISLPKPVPSVKVYTERELELIIKEALELQSGRV